jgi:cytochrome c-type biogenesis protein CcmH/NrfG
LKINQAQAGYNVAMNVGWMSMKKLAWRTGGLGLLSGILISAWGTAYFNTSPAWAAGMKPLTGGVSQAVFGLSNDIDQAEAQVKATPNDPEAHFLMAVAYSRTPYVEKALQELERSRRLARKSPEGFAMFDRKIAEYERMLLKTPNDPLIMYRLGFGYYMRGYAVANGYMPNLNGQSSNLFYDKSESILRQLVALDATDPYARDYLGFLLAERDPDKNYDAAVALWNESLKISPENPAAYMLLGQAALKKGNLKLAIESTTQALKVRNTWLEAHQIDPATLKVRL